MNNVSKWFKDNRLKANVHKCGSIVIGTRQRLRSDLNIDVKINNELVCILTKYDYLDLKITNTLSWGKHIENLCSKLAQKTSILRRMKQKVPQGLLSVIYQTTIQPYIDHCIIIWGYAHDISVRELTILSKNTRSQ